MHPGAALHIAGHPGAHLDEGGTRLLATEAAADALRARHDLVHWDAQHRVQLHLVLRWALHVMTRTNERQSRAYMICDWVRRCK